MSTTDASKLALEDEADDGQQFLNNLIENDMHRRREMIKHM